MDFFSWNEQNILYEDNHLIVCVKPFGILSQADKSDGTDMLTLLKSYLKQKYNKPGNVFVGLIHRLDRVSGGVMVFAKTSKCASRLSDEVRDRILKKRYLAVVQGTNLLSKGELKDYLIKDCIKNKVSVVSKNTPNSKLAVLSYEVKKKHEKYSLISINLITGRSHQIRAQFASRNCPLYGDKKYGSKDSLEGYIGLWAESLSFVHPTTKENMTFSFDPHEVKPFSLFTK